MHDMPLPLTTATTGIWLLDSEGRLVAAHQGGAKFLGLTPEDMLGQRLIEFWPHASHALFENALRRAAKGEMASFEFDGFTQNGRSVCWQTHLQPLHDKSNTSRQIAVLFIEKDPPQEIKSVLGEQSAETLSRFFQTLMDAVPCPIYHKNREGVYQHCNQEFAAFFGCTKEQILGKTAYDITSTDLADKYSQKDQELLEHPGHQSYEGQVKHVDGTRRTISFHKATLHRKDGSPDGLVGVMFDITDRVKIEESLRESEQKYQALTQASPVGIFKTDFLGHVNFVNYRWCQIAGLSSQDAIGTGWLRGIHPEDREQITKAWNETVKNAHPFHEEFRFRQPDGKIAWVFCQAIAKFDAQGKVSGHIGTITDITERKDEAAKVDEVNRCFLHFGADPGENIQEIVETAGRVLEGDAAAYQRLKEDQLTLEHAWNPPPDMPQSRHRKGTICDTVLTQDPKTPLVIPHLDQGPYAQSDANVFKYKLKTYIGCSIHLARQTIGALCVVYKKNRNFSENEHKLFSILSHALSIEEERKAALLSIRQNYQAQILINDFIQFSINATLEQLLERYLHQIFELPWYKTGSSATGAIFLLEGTPPHFVQRAQQAAGSKIGIACLGKTCTQCPQAPGVVIEKMFPRGIPSQWDEVRSADNTLQACRNIPIRSGQTLLGALCLRAVESQLLDNECLAMLHSLTSILATSVERKHIEERLRQEHQKNERLIDAISSAMIGVNREGRIHEWNAAAERIFNLPSTETLGRKLEECNIPWDLKRVQKALHAIEQKDPSANLSQVRFSRTDGRDGLLDLSINPVQEEGDRSAEFLILGSDITEKVRMEAQLLQAQKLESIGQLAAGIAHEINTPTQFVGDNTRFLEESFHNLSDLIEHYRRLAESVQNGKGAELLEATQAAEEAADLNYLLTEIPQAIHQSLDGVERVAKIVRAMKEFSHPDTGEKKEFDLNRAIESTITVARNEWRYVAEVETSLDPELPMVRCYPGEFNQVILNILVNAAQAIGEQKTTERKGLGKIKISTKIDNNEVEIRIADDGPGIPEKIRSKIFDPFFTTKEVGKGTGQGLTLAHAIIVEKHKGSIAVETEEGKGTTFILRLPLIPTSTLEKSGELPQ